MSMIVRLILLMLLVSLVLGVWGVNILLGESARRRELLVLAQGEQVTGAQRLARLDRRLSGKGPFAALGRRIAAAGLGWSPVTVVLGVLAAMAVMLVVGKFLVGYIASTVLALLLPAAGLQWLSRKAARRREDFTAQLPELARIIANGNSAGLSVGRCVAMAGRELSEPAGGEMLRVAAHLDLGWSLDRALHALAERLPSREINVLVRTIVIQSRTGGALTDALAEISQTLEDRKELRREVRTVILGSAMSGYAVMIIGAAAIILLNVLKPGMLDNLAGSIPGRIILIVSLALFLIGGALMRVVSRVEV
jgi:putative membrane protein